MPKTGGTLVYDLMWSVCNSCFSLQQQIVLEVKTTFVVHESAIFIIGYSRTDRIENIVSSNSSIVASFFHCREKFVYGAVT